MLVPEVNVVGKRLQEPLLILALDREEIVEIHASAHKKVLVSTVNSFLLSCDGCGNEMMVALMIVLLLVAADD